jgi:hypothetical protein
MIRATTVFLSITVAITPITSFARGSGAGHSSGGLSSGGHSSGSHSTSGHSSTGHSSSGHSYSGHSYNGRYSSRTGYHSTRVSSHTGHIVVMDDHAVRSYYKKDGTSVQSYRETNPNNTRLDNYSTKGNVNPYTGMPGTKPVVQP